jgi:hypothetical protein
MSVAQDAATVEIRPLRAPRLHRRLTAVARASALARPAVGAVLAAITAAAGGR